MPGQVQQDFADLAGKLDNNQHFGWTTTKTLDHLQRDYKQQKKVSDMLTFFVSIISDKSL